ncbi:MAG: MBOAT family protein [Lachnospiraceae bacterium]|nr:MBOAT family protein [Lachnospiraceae bacterium]MBR6485640.1 MBOAT family protein [Lachnospiraceae bacterium]
MTLISVEFFAFFLIVLAVYYILPAKLQWMWLLVAGFFFYYVNASVLQCAVFLGFLVLNYLASLRITEDNSHPRAVFRLILIFDVMFLAVMKYSGFFIDIWSWIAGLFSNNMDTAAADGLLNLIGRLCPPRISYFSLIVIGYMTDVYWGRINVQKNPGKFALFASYFPQMTSGPIVQYEQMEGSLWGERHYFSYIRFISGLERIIWGIFKKLVISERLAVMVNEIYDHYEIYPGFYIGFAAACFALQLYTDFSGLMDIVLGFSELLGIPLPENFNNPFYSTSLAQFWRRWHITLGAWLKSYVFYAVQQTEAFRKLRKFCKNKFGRDYVRKCNIPQYLGLLISWFLIGLWHGGGWNYIFGVGIYMGIVIIISELCQPIFARLILLFKINTEAFSYTLFKRFRTFILFIFGLSFFRAESLSYGFKMWKNAFSVFNPWIFFDRSLYSLGLKEKEFFILLFSLLLLLAVSMMEQRLSCLKENSEGCEQMNGVRAFLFKQNYLFRLLVFIVLFIMIICWGYYGTSYDASDFIYGRF